MKTNGWTLEVCGELQPSWFQYNRAILKEEAHALLPPYGDCKIVRVNVQMQRKRKVKKK